MSKFKVGDKVVCIYDMPIEGCTKPLLIKTGGEYTVQKSYRVYGGSNIIELKELPYYPSDRRKNTSGFRIISRWIPYDASRFELKNQKAPKEFNAIFTFAERPLVIKQKIRYCSNRTIKTMHIESAMMSLTDVDGIERVEYVPLSADMDALIECGIAKSTYGVLRFTEKSNCGNFYDVYEFRLKPYFQIE